MRLTASSSFSGAAPKNIFKGGNVISDEFAKEVVAGTGLVRVQVTQHVA
jgi:hypothetical protein